MAYEQINAAIALASNSPGVSTGYGVQAQYLVERFTRHGIKTAALSNYGLEGMHTTIKTPHGKVDHYPKGQTLHSIDVIKPWFDDFTKKHEGVPNALLTLYDVWIYNPVEFEAPIFSWVPLDSVTMPPEVRKFLDRPNVTPIAMSPHGKRQIEEEFGYQPAYIPHAVDTSIYKPTEKVLGAKARNVMGIPKDAFLVSIVAANKSNGMIHRKALAEQILAFSAFRKKHDDAYLYLHMVPDNRYGGFRLDTLLKACGVPAESVIIADSNRLRIGYDQKDLAGIYTTTNVLMNASYGEGFGVPILEASACGTPSIVGNWSSMPDVAGPTSLAVHGQPFWNNSQQCWWSIPLVDYLVKALEEMYERDRGTDEEAIKWAKNFSIEAVWNWYWMPFLKGAFGDE